MRTLSLLRWIGACALLALVAGLSAPAGALPPLPGEDEFPVETPASPNAERPFELSRLDGDRILLRFMHPRAEELGLEQPFLTLELGPARSPRSVSLASVPEPSTGLLVALGGVAGLALRRGLRR